MSQELLAIDLQRVFSCWHVCWPF